MPLLPVQSNNSIKEVRYVDRRIGYHGTRARIVKLWKSNGYLGPPTGGLRFTFNPEHAMLRTTAGADQFYMAHLHQILGDEESPGPPIVIEIDLDRVSEQSAFETNESGGVIIGRVGFDVLTRKSAEEIASVLDADRD
jgi:hypothetical protein